MYLKNGELSLEIHVNHEITQYTHTEFYFNKNSYSKSTIIFIFLCIKTKCRLIILSWCRKKSILLEKDLQIK